MKKMKKLLSVLLTLVMVLAMAAPSFAAEGDTSIKVNGKGGTFVAYKLLNAEQQEGENYIYTVNETYKDVLISVLGLGAGATDGAIVGAISQKEGDLAREFADAVYDQIKAMTPDATAEGDTFTVPQGYYLIVETATAGADDAISKVMLDTAGNTQLDVYTKSESTPTPDKEVVSEEKSFAVGDYVQYRLTATLPASYGVYSEYALDFVDEMSAGLTYVAEGADGYTGHETVIEGTTVSGTVTATSENNKTTLKISFDNLKTDTNLKAGDVITVTYWARINESAVTGANENTLKLEFSNNPYDPDGKGETTTTPDVNVYNFEVVVNKVDVNNAPLSGATFTLSRLNADMTADEADNAVKVIASADTADGVTFNFTGLKAGNYKLEETQAPAGYNVVAPMYFAIVPTYDEDGNIATLVVNVLDAEGKPVVEEVKSVDVTEAGAEGCTVATTVVNSTGAELPSTGGIGTTIFYAAGIILMAGAVFFVVRRKRA